MKNCQSLSVAVLLILIYVTGCSSLPPVAVSSMATAAPDQVTLKVFAPSSMTDAVKELAAAFETANPGVKLAIEIGHSPTQRLQLTQGAVGDVFITASQRDMDDAIEFVMAGLALLPALMFITDHVLAGAVSLVVLILVLASLGMRTPPPPAPREGDPGKPREEPAERTGRSRRRMVRTPTRRAVSGRSRRASCRRRCRQDRSPDCRREGPSRRPSTSRSSGRCRWRTFHPPPSSLHSVR